MAAPIVGEKIMGARNAWRSFQAAINQRFCNCFAGTQLAAQDPVYASTINLMALRKSGLSALALNGCL